MHVLQNSVTKVIISSLGAEIKSIIHNGKELIYQGAQGFWQRSSPILFPIVGKLNKGEYIFNDITYKLGQHGFARDMEFELKEDKNQSMTFTLSSTAETIICYPFDFELNIQYTLEKDALKISYVVKNMGEFTMFYNVGAHPAFALDLNKTYSICFDANELAVQGLDNGERVMLPKRLNAKNIEISNGLFTADTIIIDNNTGLLGNGVKLMKGNERVLELGFNCPYFGIWKQVDSPFICIEPWWGVADSASHNGELEKKEGIISLDKGEKNNHHWSIIF
jgi:galactose mutarotase-like enzyme